MLGKHLSIYPYGLRTGITKPTFEETVELRDAANIHSRAPRGKERKRESHDDDIVETTIMYHTKAFEQVYQTTNPRRIPKKLPQMLHIHDFQTPPKRVMTAISCHASPW
jgi:hypothetical protein